ncbi:DHA1 family bicyclomycin/chloramphenicol resistance-like MFS transporter [Homoserinimonas aerilata]|uniref:DHA1 family bicyclomycin/chloramphenicol resistance-like MFS transporter n=1 Tax=Homoserinimonas aerilata TaxID=1162970 RepID=A0A542YJY5_9MICO|nr:multidrug effflux MFS transporter [Homoserinimonas aerilata]TQL48407.1 DHA1 family bicyclomycin/chloramphenicol resistance-like MFS transporter [Homoserinimonas aerilata]
MPTTVDASTPSTDRRLPVVLLVLIGSLGAVGPLGTDLYLPALPEMASDLVTSAALIQATLMSFTIGLAAGQLLLGALSDRFGRRRLLIAGAVISVVSCALSALAPTIGLLILWRAVAGASAAAGLVIGRAVATDLTTGHETTRIFSILGLITGIGPIAGPLLGALVLEVSDWRTIFWVLTTICAALLIGVIILLPETLPAERRHSGGITDLLRTGGRILATRGFTTHAAALCLGFAAIFGYISASPFVLQTMLGFSPTAYTVVFAVNGVGLMITGTIASVLARRVAAARIAAVGIAILLLGGGALCAIAATGAITPFTVLPALFLVGSSMGLVFGPATALAIAQVRHASGTALALLGCGQFVLAGIAAPLVGIAGEASIVPLAVVVTVGGLGAAVCLAAGRGHRGEQEATAASPEHEATIPE